MPPRPVTLNSGAATFYVQPGSLAKGADTLTVTYTPDSNSASSYAASRGTATITITSPGSANVSVTINTLADRHKISPYIYGINTTNVNNISGVSPKLVRFGGNATSDYNWKSFTYNSGGDWFFEDFGLPSSNGNINDSVQLVKYTVNAGSRILTTMPTLDWVAKDKPAIGAIPSRRMGPSARSIPTIPMRAMDRNPTARRA